MARKHGKAGIANAHRDRGIAGLNTPGVTQAAPTVATAVNARGNAVGDTAGGYTVTVTGTTLTGATAVKFGGVAATNISVTNSTTLTCTAPDMSTTGLKDVAVTTPGGTGTASNAFRAWDPSAKSVTGWWRETVTVSSGSNVSHWVDKSGNSRDFVVSATAPQTGHTINGYPVIAFTSSTRMVGAAISALLGTTASTCFAVFKPSQTASTVGLQQDVSAWAEMNHDTHGIASYFSSAYHTATTTNAPISAGNVYTYEARVDSGTLYCLINADSGHQGTAAFTGLGGSSSAQVGFAYAGDFAEFLTDTTAWGATDRGYFYDYAATRYGLSI